MGTDQFALFALRLRTFASKRICFCTNLQLTTCHLRQLGGLLPHIRRSANAIWRRRQHGSVSLHWRNQPSQPLHTSANSAAASPTSACHFSGISAQMTQKLHFGFV